MLNEFTERILAVCDRSALNAIGPFMRKKAGGLTCFCFWGGGLNAFAPFVAVQRSAIPTLQSWRIHVLLQCSKTFCEIFVWFFIFHEKFLFVFSRPTKPWHSPLPLAPLSHVHKKNQPRSQNGGTSKEGGTKAEGRRS